MSLDWKEVWNKAYTINGHYSMRGIQQHQIFTVLQESSFDKPVIVELGICHGRTFYILCRIAEDSGGEAHGVDDFSLEGDEEEVRRMLDGFGVQYTLHACKTEDVQWDRGIDVLVVDAGHDEKNVKADCGKWIKFVKPGGVVIFHDWFTDTDMPEDHAHWAVAYYGRQYTLDKGWIDLQKNRFKPTRTSYSIRMFRRPYEA